MGQPPGGSRRRRHGHARLRQQLPDRRHVAFGDRPPARFIGEPLGNGRPAYSASVSNIRKRKPAFSNRGAQPSFSGANVHSRTFADTYALASVSVSPRRAAAGSHENETQPQTGANRAGALRTAPGRPEHPGLSPRRRSPARAAIDRPGAAGAPGGVGAHAQGRALLVAPPLRVRQRGAQAQGHALRLRCGCAAKPGSLGGLHLTVMRRVVGSAAVKRT